MSTIVRDVYDALNTQVSTTLGASWTELRFVFDVEQNDRNVAQKGYGIRPLDAISNPSVLKTYTLDQGFEIILTRTNAVEINDSDRIDAILDDLYFNASEIFKATLNTQLGIPTKVFTVFEPSMAEPEILENYIVLRLGLVVKWRELIG